MQSNYSNQGLRNKVHKHDPIAFQYLFLSKKKAQDKIPLIQLNVSIHYFLHQHYWFSFDVKLLKFLYIFEKAYCLKCLKNYRLLTVTGFYHRKKKFKRSHVFPSVNLVKMESFQRYTNKFRECFQIAY